MSPRRFFAAIAAFCCATLVWADIAVGDTREEVLRQHGFPTSIAKRGNNEYFVYPKGGRIELLDGKVTDVRGPLPPRLATADSAPAAAATPAPAPAYKPTATAPPANASPTKPVPAPAPAKPAPPPPAVPVDDGHAAAAAANAALSAHIEKMDTAWGSAPPPPSKPHSPLDSIPSFLAGLVLRFGFTLGALKLAFKYWEMDAFWKGIFAIAGIDVALHALLELLGPVTGDFTTMSGVENGIPGVVLIFTINRFCFNKRLQNAVATAAAVKVVVTLLYIFGAVAMLNVAFG